MQIGNEVPWNAAWSGEEVFEIRPCRYVDMRLAVWQKHAPGLGRPLFTKPHCVRQRKSIAEMRCTVCGEKTNDGERWWFPIGSWRDGYWMSNEAPLHKDCSKHSLAVCPMLRKRGAEAIKFPDRWMMVTSIVGGEQFERDYGLKRNGRTVYGQLKLAWKKPPFEFFEIP